MKFYILLFTLFFGVYTSASAQDTDPKTIIQKMDENIKGKSSKGEIKMTIVRPKWTREMRMKSWSKGNDYNLILVTSPARDKGISFLKRKKELWSWRPSIDRTVKMPPSMMSQSWMGSDFTNDDLVRQSSIVEDYTHKLLGNEKVDSRDCYKIELLPKEDAVVVWGKVIIWVEKEHYVQLKTEFYDEDEYLVNTMLGSGIKEFDGRYLASKMEIIPEEDKGHKTIIEQVSIEFDISISEDFFSVQNMKRIR